MVKSNTWLIEILLELEILMIYIFSVIIQLLLCLPTVQLILGIKYYYYTYEECPIKDGKVQLYLLVNGVSFTIAGLFAWMIASCNFYKKGK